MLIEVVYNIVGMKISLMFACFIIPVGSAVGIKYGIDVWIWKLHDMQQNIIPFIVGISLASVGIFVAIFTISTMFKMIQ